MLRNTDFLHVCVSAFPQSSLFSFRKPARKDRSQEETYNLSRWTPVIKDVMEVSWAPFSQTGFSFKIKYKKKTGKFDWEVNQVHHLFIKEWHPYFLSVYSCVWCLWHQVLVSDLTRHQIFSCENSNVLSKTCTIVRKWFHAFWPIGTESLTSLCINDKEGKSTQALLKPGVQMIGHRWWWRWWWWWWCRRPPAKNRMTGRVRQRVW